jgi:hypothetical protein
MQILTPGQSGLAVVDSCATPAAQPVCFLSAHAYCCEFADGAVLLDLRGDTYVGIDARHLRYLRCRVANWSDADSGYPQAEHHDGLASEKLVADLLARGILTTSHTPVQPRPAEIPSEAMTAGFAKAPGRIPMTHVARFCLAFLIVSLRLRRNGLAGLLNWLRRRQSSIPHNCSAASANTTVRLMSFLYLRTFCYTAQRRCLFDSLVLSVYLTRAMIPCTLSIGVATKPFLAHAWVQIGASVLNDTAEHVQEFKPILSVGRG